MYIGNDLQIANPSYKVIDDISSSFNGSATSFALNVKGATPVPFPINEQQVMISVNGVIQEPDATGSAGFKLLGSNIVFSSAPANGNAFFGVILAGADYVTAGSEFPDGTVTAPSFTFESDLDSGFFRSGSGAVGYSANGVQKALFDGNGLTVTGTCTATAFSGNGANLTNVTANAAAAGTLTGGTLASGVTASSLTSVGTLTSLGVTGNLTVDTNTLHVDATNNRVGIGTTSPSSLLNLKRTSTTGYSTSSTTNDTSLLVQNIGAAGHSTIQLDVKSGGTANIGQATISAFPENNSSKATALSFGTRDNSGNQATERMRIDSSGKVGIGTTAPAKLLTVDAASGDGELQVSGSTGGRINLKDTGSGEEFLIACAGDAHIQALTGGKSIVLKTTPSGGSVTTALTLDSSQNATFAGNISVNGGSNTTQATFTGTASRGLKISTANQTSPGTMADASVIYDAQTLISGTLYGEHQFQTGGTTRVTINRFGNLIGTGTISDSKGDLRSIVQNHKTGAYTLIASDAGKMITITTGGVTVNNSIFSAGQAVSIINHSGSDQTITQGSSFTLHNTADATTGNRTLAGRGMATMWFSSHNEAYISGAGLS